MTGQLGRRYGNYRLTRLLGEGSFAEVYLAEHIHLDSQAAIKLLRVVLLNEHKDPFLTEARRLARLKHPHIVRLLDFGIEADVPFLVMEYASNGSMRTKHPKGSQVPLETVINYVNQIADALQYIHEQKLVHRDIKPENILLAANQEIWVSDLGIAAIAHETGSIVPQGQAGTLTYMAPEQILEVPRPASDQYSLGIIVYEWLCGKRPFHGPFAELYKQHLYVPPPSLKDKVPDLPPSVEEVVLTALAKDPQQRFSSVVAFATALEQASQSERHHAQSSAFSAVSDQGSSTNSVEEQATTIIHSWSETIAEQIDTAQTIDASQPVIAEQKSMNSAPLEISSESKLYLPMPFPNEHIEKVTAPLPVLEVQKNDAMFLQQNHKANSRKLISSAMPEQPVKSIGGRRGSSRRTKWFLLSAILILLVALIGVIVLIPLRNFVSSAPASVVTRIVSKNIELKNTYPISAVTGKPDAAQHQVQARLLTYRIPSQMMRVMVSGIKIIPGTQAAGMLTFYNGSLTQETVGAGTIFTGSDGEKIINDEPAIIPGAKPPTEGSVSVTAHAVNVGISGNIKALDIHYTCCVVNDYIFVENLSPFKGGKDEQQIAVVQQSDIDGVVSVLSQQARTSLLSQVRSNEQLVNPPQCIDKEASNHSPGDKAISILITASVLCTAEVYDQQAAEAMAADLLRSEASKSPGSGYKLMGKIVTNITQAIVTDPKNGTVLLVVETEGIWISG